MRLKKNRIKPRWGIALMASDGATNLTIGGPFLFYYSPKEAELDGFAFEEINPMNMRCWIKYIPNTNKKEGYYPIQLFSSKKNAIFFMKGVEYALSKVKEACPSASKELF